jgi:hypothetical protein
MGLIDYLAKASRAREALAAVVLVTTTAGCADVLGLSAGLAETDAGDGASPYDGAAPEAAAPEGGTPDAADPVEFEEAQSQQDVAASEGAPEEPAPEDAAHVDAVSGDAACRTALQPCQHDGDCCSGICGVALTCL